MGFLMRRTKSTTTGRTELLQLIQSQKWREAIARARSQPLEVSEWYVEKYEDIPPNYSSQQSMNQVKVDYKGISSSASNPASSQKIILERLLPLHLACELNAPFELIATLLDVYPEAALMREYGQGSTPLHLACTSPVLEARDVLEIENRSKLKAQTRTLQLLLSYYPKSIEVVNNLGQLPIHLACAGNLDQEVINVLLDAWRHKSKSDLCVDNSCDKTSSSCLEQKDKQGNIPLHLLCQSVIIQRDAMCLLISKAPHTVYIRNYAGETAADILNAGWCGNKRAMLDLLKKDSIYWKLYVNGASLLNSSGAMGEHEEVEISTKSDLHKHLERVTGFSDENTCNTIIHHLQSHPEEAALFFCMNDGDFSTWRRYLPVHLAIEKCANPKIISTLIEVYPDSVKKTNNVGQLPLNLCCEYGYDYMIFDKIFSLYKEAVKHVDSYGMTSLHSACWGGSDIDIIRAIFTAYSEALTIEDRFGRTPRIIAERRGHMDIANYLKSQENVNATRYVTSQSVSKLKFSLIELIEQQMWYDVLNKCSDIKIGPYHLHTALKYRPPTQVVKRFLEKIQMNLDELNLAIDVAEKRSCSKEVINILLVRQHELFPAPVMKPGTSHVNKEVDEWNSLSENSQNNMDGIVLVATESLDDGDTRKMPKMGFVHEYLRQQKPMTQTQIFTMNSNENTVFVPYSKTTVNDKIEYVASCDPIASEVEMKLTAQQVPNCMIVTPMNDNAFSSPSEPLACSSTSTEVRSNKAPSISYRSVSNCEDEQIDVIEETELVSENVMLENQGRRNDQDTDLDLAESYFQELERRLASRDVQDHQLMDSAMSRSTSNSSESTSHDQHRDCLSNGSIEQFYTERDRRLSAESLSFDPILSSGIAHIPEQNRELPVHKHDLQGSEYSRPAQLTFREETLANFGLYANVDESYSSLLAVGNKIPVSEPMPESLSTENVSENHQKKEIISKNLNKTRLSPLHEETEAVSRLSKSHLIDKLLLLQSSFLFGGIFFGLGLRSVMIKFPLFFASSIAACLLLNVSEKDSLAGDLFLIVINFFKRVYRKSKPYEFRSQLMALQGKSPRIPFPSESMVPQEQYMVNFTSFRASLSMGFLGGTLFWLFSHKDNLGWILVGSFLLSSIAYIDDEKGDFARCLGMFFYVLFIEMFHAGGCLFALYEKVATKHLKKWIDSNNSPTRQ